MTLNEKKLLIAARDAALTEIEKVDALLDELIETRQMRFDDMTEAQQASERGQALESEITDLSQLKESAEEAINAIEQLEIE